MNKEPKEVDWSKQKPGTIGVTRDGKYTAELLANHKSQSVFWLEPLGVHCRNFFGRWSNANLTDSDILLPWESQIAEGHNPDGLTNAHVGEGWRLIGSVDDDLDMRAEWWSVSGLSWRARIKDHQGLLCPYFASDTYRVPITKPKRRIPCGPEHFPPGTILRHSDYPNAWQMVIWVQSHGIGSMDAKGEFVKERYGQLVGFNGQRSIDGGKTWLPCYVETEE